MVAAEWEAERTARRAPLIAIGTGAAIAALAIATLFWLTLSALPVLPATSRRSRVECSGQERGGERAARARPDRIARACRGRGAERRDPPDRGEITGGQDRGIRRACIADARRAGKKDERGEPAGARRRRRSRLPSHPRARVRTPSKPGCAWPTPGERPSASPPCSCPQALHRGSRQGARRHGRAREIGLRSAIALFTEAQSQVPGSREGAPQEEERVRQLTVAERVSTRCMRSSRTSSGGPRRGGGQPRRDLFDRPRSRQVQGDGSRAARILSGPPAHIAKRPSATVKRCSAHGRAFTPSTTLVLEVSHQVVPVEHPNRGPATNAGVWAMPVVVVSQRASSARRSSEWRYTRGIRPLEQRGLDTALDFAVGAGRIPPRKQLAHAQPLARRSEAT